MSLKPVTLPSGRLRLATKPSSTGSPDVLKTINPLGKAPMIRDGEVTIIESGAIIEYITNRNGGRLAVGVNSPNYGRYLQWMHFAEGTIMLHLVARLYLGRVGDAAKTREVLAKFGTVEEFDGDGKPVRTASTKQ